ncbi:MAG: cyclic pyranopterin monophosphate synthase MoaC [Planctomycetes bacterium]|nr:cyclic pyranopterin monophosphate synthase MoaC [Planctomycetota bacterium]
MARLTHLDAAGSARMVDVGDKPVTRRTAVAACRIRMKPGTLSLLIQGTLPKGDALAVARVAGIQAAKKAAELIPLCHPVATTKVEIELTPAGRAALDVRARVDALDRTGVEMEALTAAAVAALALYDMCKAVDRGMEIDTLRLLRKAGGRSGEWVRPPLTNGPTRRNTS